MRTQQEEYTDHKVNVAECNNLETHQLRAISEWRSPITTPHRKDTMHPLVLTVLLWLARFNQFGSDAEPDPPDRASNQAL